MTNRDDRGGRGPQQPALPKPYEFVPLPEGRIPTAPPAGHNRYAPRSLTGTLTATIIARSPVHVASGLLEQVNDHKYPLVKALFRTNGTPAIPGTSIKGCIRSIVEAITRSSVQVTRARELSHEYQPSRSIDQLDVAQRIFGALGYQGMVRFADALLIGGRTTIIPSVQLFRPRSEAVDIYFERGRARGRKFYMHGKLAEGNLPLEACAIDSRFAVRMDFENMTAGEVGLVLTALGLGEPKLWPKLGGGKPACLGTIEVIEPVVTVLDTNMAYADFDAMPQPQDIKDLIEAAKALILEEQVQRLAVTLLWPRENRECPDENRECPDRSY